MNNLNAVIFNAINGLAATHLELNNFMIFFAKYIIFVIPAYLLFILVKKRFKEFLFLTSSIILALLFGYLTKIVFYHPRPFAIGMGIDLVKDDLSSSFPSDHTTAMFAFATSMFLEKRYIEGGIATFLGLLLGFARVYIGVHFPFDIFGGILFGIVFSWANYYAIFPYVQRFVKKTGFNIV